MGMRKLALLLILFSSCASVELTDGGKKVRVVHTSPHHCKYLGQVAGNFLGKSVKKGIVNDSSIYELAFTDMKNEAGDLGADTVELSSLTTARTVIGEAYKCDKQGQ